MTKEEALYSFWSLFGFPAYDELSVPSEDRNVYPRITYSVGTDSYGSNVPLTASIWTRGTSWTEADRINQTIANAIGYGVKIPYDGGGMIIRKGRGFSKRMGDDDDELVKRYYLLVNVQYISNN